MAVPAMHYTDPATSEPPLLPATLKFVRRCPARADYLELCFATPEGPWRWCFSEPPEREAELTGPLALTMGRYGAQARRRTEDGLGPALPNEIAVPMIRGGAEVWVARKLVISGR